MQRVENQLLLTKFRVRKNELSRDMLQSNLQLEPISPPLLEYSLIDAATNEYWLFHGTSVTKAMSIAERGYDKRIAYCDCFYGIGCYLTSDLCIALQCPSGAKETCILMGRVLLGRAFYTSDVLYQNRIRTTRDLWNYLRDDLAGSPAIPATRFDHREQPGDEWAPAWTANAS